MNGWIRYRWLLLFGVIFFLSSCSKHADSHDSGCITRVVPKLTDSLLPRDKLDSINALFRQNNLSTANLQFYSFGVYAVHDSTFNGIREEIIATQFYNNLPLFSPAGDKLFLFNNGQLQPPLLHYWDGYDGPAPNMDTAGHQALSTLRSAFYESLAGYINPGGPAQWPDSNYSVDYHDSCLVAKLGYIDAAWAPGSTVRPNTALIKVWKVTPQSGEPASYVPDNSGLPWPAALIFPKDGP